MTSIRYLHEAIDYPSSGIVFLRWRVRLPFAVTSFRHRIYRSCYHNVLDAVSSLVHHAFVEQGDLMQSDPGSILMDDDLAFFLTWTTYGTWLPGDDRGWVDKPGRWRRPSDLRKARAQKLMTEPALTLDIEQRQLVEATIVDHSRPSRLVPSR